MSLISRLLGGSLRAETPGPGADFWYQPTSGPSASGQRVTPDSALRVAAVYACVKVLAETIAQLPLVIYRRLPGGGKERATDHPLYDILRNKPNNWQTAFEFREMMAGHLALRGNAYAEIVPGPRGHVDQLIPLHPDRVRVNRLGDGKLWYEIRPALSANDRSVPLGEIRTLRQDEIHHWRGLSSDGIVGMSPIEAERESIGMALAAQDYAARFFANDATPPGTIEHPQKISDDAHRRLRNTWQQTGTGAERHKVRVLEEGMKYTQIGMTNRDAQFIDARKYQDVDIARIFRMPPHKIGILDRATFSNIEHQGIEFVTDTIGPWLRRIEQAVSRDLITVNRVYFAEFVVEALLRGDIKARYEAYGMAIRDGWMVRNEARVRENMNKIDGLDEPLRPLNMAVGEQPAALVDWTGRPLPAQNDENSKSNGKGY